MDAGGFTLELCGKGAGHEARPPRLLTLDLADVQGQLADAGFDLLSNAGILLVARLGPIEVSVFESGRLLLKTQDREVAHAVTAATYRALGVGS